MMDLADCTTELVELTEWPKNVVVSFKYDGNAAVVKRTLYFQHKEISIFETDILITSCTQIKSQLRVHVISGRFLSDQDRPISNFDRLF